MRAGKYKSSDAAYDSYVSDLRKQRGEIWKLVKYASFDNQDGAIFSTEKGDSVFYSPNTSSEMDFIPLDEKKNIESKICGKEFVYIGRENHVDISYFPNMPEARRLQFIDLKTNKGRYGLPEFSVWTIEKLDVDTTFVNSNGNYNDLKGNAYCRLVAIARNPRIGQIQINLQTLSFDALGDLSNYDFFIDSARVRLLQAFVLKKDFMDNLKKIGGDECKRIEKIINEK